MPRQARLDAPGTLHHVILRGIEKRQIVSDDQDRENFITRLGNLAKETETNIYAWALMTNHAHILLRSGPGGLPSCMRRLLCGYAITYNRRHGRYGHLFQNRYKSIICEEELYFLELVRYIHLNPLRAGLVKSIAALGRYRWSGHSVLMGRRINDWQATDDVLQRFGKSASRARIAYEAFVAAGVEEGNRPDLVGGGLIRSLGGWSEVKALRRLGIHEAADERILGSGQFVEQVIKEAEENVRRHFPALTGREEIERIVLDTCDQACINVRELRAGSRRQAIVSVRMRLIALLVEQHGVSLAETARQVGVSTSAISKALARRNVGKVK